MMSGLPAASPCARSRSATWPVSAINPSARRISQRCNGICSGLPSPGWVSASCTITRNGTPARRSAAAITKSSAAGMPQIATSGASVRMRAASAGTSKGVAGRRDSRPARLR